MNEKISFSSAQATHVVNSFQFFSGTVGVVGREDFINRILKAARMPEMTFPISLEVSIDTLRDFRLGILGGWNVPGRTDPQLSLLRSCAKALKIWGWIEPNIPKSPEEKEYLPLDIEDDVEMDQVEDA